VKLTLDQKVVTLSAIGLLRQRLGLVKIPKVLRPRYDKIGTWFESKTGAAGGVVYVGGVPSMEVLLDALLTGCESVVGEKQLAELTRILGVSAMHSFLVANGMSEVDPKFVDRYNALNNWFEKVIFVDQPFTQHDLHSLVADLCEAIINAEEIPAPVKVVTAGVRH